MRHLTRHGYRRRGLAGGVAFVYFSLLALPAFFFGAGMATDFTRIIIANRQVANAAQAAAQSGAQQFIVNAAEINATLAVTKAVDTYCTAQNLGAMSLSKPHGSGRSCPGGSTATITVTPIRSGTGAAAAYTAVDVTARYKVDGLIFTSLFTSSRAVTPAPVTRSAAVCLPGNTSGPTNGYCAHPDAPN